MRIRHLLTIIFIGLIIKGFSQTITCYNPTLSIQDGSTFAPISSTINCDYANLIRISPSTTYSLDIFGNPVASDAPCMRLETSLTNTNSTTNNSITVFQGTTNIGSVCNLCSSSIPNNMLYTLYYAGLDPSQTHAYALCHSAFAANMTYTVMSCYSNVVLASGTWTNASAGGCQTVNIPAGSAIGTSSYAITPTISPTGFFDLGNGSLYLDTYVMPAGTYTVTYTFNTQAGCITTQTIVIKIVNPYNAAWTTVSPLCSNGPCVNLPPQVTGTAGGSWSGPAVSSGSFCPASVGAGTFATTYSVGVSATCGASNTKTITVIAQPTANAGPTESITCTQSTFTVLSGSGGGGYSWTGPGITAGAATANPTVNATPGVYSLITTSLGCSSAAATVQVVINQNPPNPTTIPSNTITCLNPAVTAAITPTAGMTYTWVASPGNITGGSSAASATVNQAGTYNFTVTNSANGCINNGFVTVTSNTTVSNVPSTSNTVTCSNLNINLTTAVAGAGPFTYTWTAPGGSSITGGTFSQNATGSGAGVYSVTVKDGSNGCSKTATVAANVNTTAPTATATSGGAITCTNTAITLSVNPGGLTYAWTAGGGGSITGGAASQNATGAGNGTYSVLVTAANGCTVMATVSPSVNMTPPTFTATATGVITCTNNAINLTVNPSGSTYAWTAGGGGSITSGASSQNATGSGNATYSVLVTTSNGCTVMATASPSVNQVVITPTITVTNTLTCMQPTVTLTGAPAAGVTYTWSAPSGTNIVTGVNAASVAVNAPVVYTLTVTNTVNGCVGTKTVQPTQSLTTPTLSAASQTANLVCGASSVVLSGNVLPAASSITWTSPGGGFASGVNNSTVAVTTATTYVLSAANPATGCISSLTYTVIPDVNSPTVTLSSPSGTLTCLTTQLSTTATSNPAAGVTYSWTGPGIVGSATGAAVTGSLAGTYNLAVTNTSNSCVSNVSYIITANNAPVTPTATSSNTLTCNTLTTSLTAGAGAGTYTYTWSGPSGFTNTSQSFTTTTGGTYTVFITNTSSGCTGSVTVSVSTDTIAPGSLTVTPSSYTLPCAPPTATLTAGAVGASSYSWTAPFGGSITSGTTASVAGISGPGNYSVVAIGANGCSSTVAIAAIAQSTLAPTYTLSNSSPSITCFSAGPTVSVVITSTVPISSYSWSPAAGMSGPTNTSVATFTLAGTYTSVITATNGCQSNVILTVTSATMAPTIVAGTGTASTLGCGSNSVVTIAPAFTPASNLTYTWSGAGIVGSANNPSVTVNMNGTYSLVVTNTLTGCSTNSITVPVFGSNVAPTLTIVSSSSIGIGCTPTTSTITLTANSTPGTGVSYNWSNAATTQVISISTPGIYSVTVTDLSGGCSVSGTLSVANNTTVPTVNAGANGSLPCGAAGTFTLNGSSTTAGVTYSWSGAGFVSGASTQTPVINQPGIFTLTVSNPTTGCSASGTVAMASSSVQAGFTPDQTTGVSPLTVNFTNTSTGAINYNWSFGNGSTSTQTNTSATYSTSQTYTVTLIASSGLCSDTVSIDIVVNDGLTLEIPNVFTPNEDGVNDMFTITSTGVKEISLQIFNRWGQRMYEFTGAKAAWDGLNSNGQKVSDGTYFYFVKATGFDDKEISKNGSVSLFR